jgi:hypothetical protein
MRKCPGRVDDCPINCIYELEKIWCTCYDTPNIHMWHYLNSVVPTCMVLRVSE